MHRSSLCSLAFDIAQTCVGIRTSAFKYPPIRDITRDLPKYIPGLKICPGLHQCIDQDVMIARFHPHVQWRFFKFIARLKSGSSINQCSDYGGLVAENRRHMQRRAAAYSHPRHALRDRLRPLRAS